MQKQLISLGTTPSRLKTVIPISCLSCLLGKTRRKPWRTKDDHNHARSSYSIVPIHYVSMDLLTNTIPGIKLQLTGSLTNTPIVGAQVFADHSSSTLPLYAHLLENITL